MVFTTKVLFLLWLGVEAFLLNPSVLVPKATTGRPVVALGKVLPIEQLGLSRLSDPELTPALIDVERLFCIELTLLFKFSLLVETSFTLLN